MPEYERVRELDGQHAKTWRATRRMALGNLNRQVIPFEISQKLSRANSGTKPSHVARHIKEIPPEEPHRLCNLQVAESQGERPNCDESKPACGNCVKHNVECDFVSLAPQAPSLSPGPSGALDMQSLELLHNFTTRTFATLSDSILIRDFYRQSAVQLGLRCDYIMRTVLAVSALHLAYHRPEMRDHYRSLAMTHHQVASRDAMPLMTDADPPTAEKLFLFSVLTIYFALACPRKGDGALLVGESGYPEWMFLLQGTRAFIRILGPGVDGPVAPLFNHGADRWMARQPNVEPTSHVHEHLDSMRSMISLRQANLDLRNTYLRAIDELAKSFSVFDGTGSAHCDLTDAFVWVFEIAEDLLPLLRAPTQEAVTIFAFFTVLLKRLEKHWWLQGWADHLIAKSYKLLDEEHRLWIQWPLQETGYAT